jgi:hypothetical protein
MTSAGAPEYDYNYAPISSQVFYLVNPPTGTNTLVVNATASSGTIQEIVANLSSFNGVNQTTPVRPGTYQTLHSAVGVPVDSCTATISSNPSELAFSAVEATYDFTSSASNQTVDGTAAAYYKVGSDHATTAASSISDTWSFTTPYAFYAYVGFSIQAASGGAVYYLAPAAGGGSDFNDGLSSSAPWLTPNHALNCGDVIIAAASTAYSNVNFTSGKWGTVTCASGNNVAWLKCVAFDACKSSGAGTGFWIDRSYWGVQGWEVTQTRRTSCFLVAPNADDTVHHVVFANNIANSCQQSGFGATGSNPSTDYIAFVGNIAYNAAQSPSSVCGQGFSIYAPIASDTLPGTHLYVAGNFAWDNVDNANCNGGAPTDGEGIELDTFDKNNYDQQTVVENNIFVYNGGPGIQTLLVNTGTVYIRQNTLYGNMRDTHIGNCGEYLDSAGAPAENGNIHLQLNIAATTASSACNGATWWAYATGNSTTNLKFDSGIAYSAAGHNCGPAYGPDTACSANGLTILDPVYANPLDPPAPNCGSASSVPNCMATVISNFTPTAAGAAGHGYQIPNARQSFDPLFPQWLCNVNLPDGLVTMGCN